MVRRATLLFTPLTPRFPDVLSSYNEGIVAVLVMGYIAKKIQYLVYSCAEFNF